MSEFASPEAGYEAVESEPRELAWRNVRTGSHLWASATAFFFIGFVFAYFYLRSIDKSTVWRPAHVNPSFALGTAGTATIVAAAVAITLGLRNQRSGHRAQWLREGAFGLALLVATAVLQVAEWVEQSFGPSQGAYASVFIGWTSVLWVFVLGAIYWLETVFATAIRYRDVPEGEEPPAGHASGDPFRMGADISDPLSLVRPQLTAVSFYLQFLAGIALLSWIVLYLV